MLFFVEGLEKEDYHILPDRRKPTKRMVLEQLEPNLKQAWQDVCELAGDSGDEKTMCRPIAKFLTLLMKFELLFVPWNCVTAATEGELSRQDIIAVKAKRDEIEQFHNSNQAREALPPKYLFRDSTRIYYADIQCVIEVRRCKFSDKEQMYDHVIQLLKYLFMTSRYQPRCAAHRGVLAYRDGFMTVDYYPDAAFHSQFYPWSSNLTLDALKETLGAERRFIAKEFILVDPPQKSDENNPLSRFRFRPTPDLFNPVEYQLYDLHHGDGWTGNTYVGFAIPVGERIDENLKLSDCMVVKHCWHDTGSELDVVEEIYHAKEDGRRRCTAGLVRVDLEHSRAGKVECVEVKGKDLERKSITLILKTIGDTLAHCQSVREFLMVMYDLVEVHRMLVEDHDILHRDISWSNILINAVHLDGKEPDDLCDRPFIDVVLGVQKAKQKVHATLSDYDCARILNKPRERASTAEITGTPMFMSKALCLVHERKRDILNSPFVEAFDSVYGENLSGVLQDTNRSEEVFDFLQVVKDLDGSKRNRSKRAESRERVAHAPVHDAESIFWIIIFFFLRACPQGYDRSAPSEKWRRIARTRVFGYMTTSGIGDGFARDIPESEALPIVFHRFIPMLQNLHIYFNVAWYCMDEVNAHKHHFHGHNALQHVLLKEIQALDGEDISLEREPLGINLDNHGVLKSNHIYGRSTRKRPSDDETGNASRSRKRQNCGSESNLNEESIQDQGVVPAGDVTAAHRVLGILKDFKQHKRWFMGSIPRRQLKVDHSGECPI